MFTFVKTNMFVFVFIFIFRRDGKREEWEKGTEVFTFHISGSGAVSISSRAQ